ncbi:MAG: hypothetical protein M3M94_04935 [Actinomycetota bacterium]|nr:hypothetical protein [Actinomycetota bacterium]
MDDEPMEFFAKSAERTCCGNPMTWLLGRRERGKIFVEVWRCEHCEALTRFAGGFPAWISATERVVVRLSDEIIADAYGAA